MEPTATVPRRPALPLLTSLRFFAAAEVVVFHTSIGASLSVIPEGLVRDLASGGFAAVAFFFVLSGFVLVYAHAGARERDGSNVSAGTFWRLRFARLAPAYYLGLLYALPALLAYVTSPATSRLSAIANPLLVFLFLQAWWPPATALWNFPAWSLSVECLFYALFPWLARHATRLSRRTLFATTYVLIVAIAVWRGDGEAYFPLPHLPLFVFGMTLGRQFLFGPPLARRTHAAMFYIGAALTMAIFADRQAMPWWTHSDAVLAPVFALVIFGAAGAGRLVPLLAQPFFVRLGEASYAMYILHIPIRFSWKLLTTELGLEIGPRLSILVYLALVVGVSLFVFRYVETPLRRLIGGRR
jgi:peptidoglycan/LPS O-acetylase OafA/YrhL